VLSEQGAGLPREHAQQAERLWCESERLSIAQQEGVRFVQFEGVEAHAYRVRARRVCAFCARDSAMRAVRNDIRLIHS
jgi:hypothetical protein